jgi:predicted DNA-binding WGR domain protein
MPPSILHRIDPAKNMRRRYEISLQPTLFGPVAVIRHWGRIGGGGQTKEDWLASDAEATAMAARILGEKRRRGYAEPTG